MHKFEQQSTLKSLRLFHKLSVEQLAETIGVSVAAVNAWEQGKSVPHLKYVKPLMDIYWLSFEELLVVIDNTLGLKGKSLDEIGKRLNHL